MTIAIIGAGMAGLSAATALSKNGKDVVLFDKGRGPGGRMSTRRAETRLGQLRFDHGAQYFTPRDPRFVAEVEGWVADGAAAKWSARFVNIDAAGGAEAASEHPRYVGMPGMNGIIRTMADKLNVTWNARVTEAAYANDRWSLGFEDGTLQSDFDAVIIAMPSEQARVLLSTLPHVFDGDGLNTSLLSAPDSAPCWTAMLAFDAPVDIPFDGAKVENSPLSWLARNSSKPGRDTTETWVLHASPEWSEANLEDDKDNIAQALIVAFQALGLNQTPVFTSAHRWRYAQVIVGQSEAAAWSAAHKIGVCGDWMMGPRIENAWLSGQALAETVA